MRAAAAIALASIVWFATLSAATQFVAAVFAHQVVLGASVAFADWSIYPPWALLEWRARWRDAYPRPFAVADLIVCVGFAMGAVTACLALRRPQGVKPFGRSAWANFEDVRSAKLFAKSGTVLGEYDGELLCFEGPEHQILIGASRSGKGRGHVVPTLLAWPHAALVLDIKGELADGDLRHGFPGTSGFRETIGPVLRFTPTRLCSASFNPLHEVRRGPDEVRDVQNIVEILVDPNGDGRNQDFWDRSAKNILTGVVLHVLYAEPPARKTLAVVRAHLRDLDAAAQAMKSTLHRLNPQTNLPEVHPEVLHAAESFLAGEERLQSGIKATAESHLGLFADEIVAANTARSDFRIGDLMCAEKPVTLYLQPPPSDALRLMPLMRLIINQIARTLMEDQNADAQGRAKRHRLLLVLDEFPMLGRMPFFETMMGSMAGYGLKAFLICQSLNHLTKAYGRDNVILDNCHIVTSFAAADGDTAKRIADMAGEVWELRQSETHTRPSSILGWRKGSTTVREERRPLLIAGEVRALPRDEQLIFVSGAKPIRAKKLNFDQHRAFTPRLLAPARKAARLTTDHDWEDIRSLGVIARPKHDPARPAMKKPLAEQPDLFAQAAAKRGSLSEQAAAGLAGADGAVRPASSQSVSPPQVLAVESAVEAQALTPPKPRQSRSRGI